MVTSIETPTMPRSSSSQPAVCFLSVNLIPSAIGIVPANAGADFFRHPSLRPVSICSAIADEEVVVERNPEYFRDAPQISHVRFRVVLTPSFARSNFAKVCRSRDEFPFAGHHSRSRAPADLAVTDRPARISPTSV